jgi:hypothetical protein
MGNLVKTGTEGVQVTKNKNQGVQTNISGSMDTPNCVGGPNTTVHR